MVHFLYAHFHQPDGVQRGLVGEIIKRFESRGFQLTALKLVHSTPEHLEKRTWSLLFKFYNEKKKKKLNRLLLPPLGFDSYISDITTPCPFHSGLGK